MLDDNVSISKASPLHTENDPQSDRGDVVIISANDNHTRFAVSRRTLQRLSPICADIFASETADSDEQTIDLEESFGSPDIVELLATWLNAHDTREPFQVRLPVPVVTDPALLFDEWESVFFGKLVCGPNFDPRGVPRLQKLARLAGVIQLQSLVRQCVALIAHFISIGIREHGEPTLMVRRWFGKQNDYTDAEQRQLQRWMLDTFQDTVGDDSTPSPDP